jgi:hypothetical protein
MQGVPRLISKVHANPHVQVHNVNLNPSKIRTNHGWQFGDQSHVCDVKYRNAWVALVVFLSNY